MMARLRRTVRAVARGWERLSSTARRTLSVTGAAVAVFGLLALAVYLPPHLLDTTGITTPENRLKAENDLRTTLVQALGGTILLVGLYFTARNVGLTREGQITERFTKAITQLGDKNLDVRLGGIYALERIARESAKDYGPIMEVLTAFLREHARSQPDAAHGEESTETPPAPGSNAAVPPRLRRISKRSQPCCGGGRRSERGRNRKDSIFVKWTS
jgi:hypothetical protein